MEGKKLKKQKHINLLSHIVSGWARLRHPERRTPGHEVPPHRKNDPVLGRGVDVSDDAERGEQGLQS